MIETGEKVTRFIVLGDQQEPYGDERAQRLVVEVMKSEADAGRNYDYCVDLGDRFDFDGLTLKFLRKPGTGLDLRRVVNSVAKRFNQENEALGEQCKRVWLAGNHEQRLPNYVYEAAPALYDLLDTDQGVLTVPFFLKHYGADISNLQYVEPYGNDWRYKFGGGGEFIFTHGDSHSKYASAVEVSDKVKNGMSGQLHRMQVTYKTTYDNVFGWWSNGCLCNIEGDNVPPGKKKGPQSRNWQQGFSTIEFSRERNLFSVTQHLIHRGKALVFGKQYVDRGGRG